MNMWYLAAADLEQQINQLGIRTVVIASIILFASTLIVLALKNNKKVMKHLRLPLFLTMAGTLVVSTLILFGGTIYLNTKAESKGPVHWHADIEFWVCGTEMELRDPTGFLSNKIGTATYHEHNDKRIHLEGVVVKKSEDASLKKFMNVTGGYINSESMALPLNEDPSEWLATGDKTDGDKQLQINPQTLEKYVTSSAEGASSKVLTVNKDMQCYDQPSEVQVFVYTYNEKEKTYSQRKLEKPEEYIMRDEPNVPPGDCVIVEFAPRKESTKYLCEQYGVRDHQRCKDYGVKEYSPELCNLRFVGVTE